MSTNNKNNNSNNKTTLQITLVVTSYFIISIALVFINKLLLNNKEFSTPIFVTWYQCLLSGIIIYVLGLISNNSSSNSIYKEFTYQTYDLYTAYKVLPLSIIFVCMIIFNNLCLLYVHVSFYNVARSLTIVFNVILTYIMLNETTSYNVLITLFIVIAGFFIGSNGEVDFSLIGTLYGVTSSLFVSLNSIYTKKIMKYVNNDKWKLSFYNNVNAIYMFIPLIFIFNEHNILLINIDILFTFDYWLLMSLAGVLGFMIGIVTVMQINYTSPLTHNISGTAKACVQTLLSLVIFPHQTTVRGNVGLFATIVGSALYAYVRMNENNNNNNQQKIEQNNNNNNNNYNKTISNLNDQDDNSIDKLLDNDNSKEQIELPSVKV